MACNAYVELLNFSMESIVIYILLYCFIVVVAVVAVATARLFQFNLSRSPINLLRIMLWAPRRQLAESLLLLRWLFNQTWQNRPI